MNKNILESVDEEPFKLEKEIQEVVESNLNKLFLLDFVATEFPIENFKFDTVAFNNDTKSFVIIEYKRGRNESLVDQGYAYLHTLLNRKADFVLLYNDIFSTSFNIKDFDWSISRIIYISLQFTDYQKNATSFSTRAFKLFEIKRFTNGVVLVNEISNRKTFKVASDPVDNIIDNSMRKVVNEIVVYSEEEHLNKGTEKSRELYEELRVRVLELGDIKIEPKKYYIAFKGKRNIIDVIIQKKQVKISINLKEGSLKDHENMTTMMDHIGTLGNGDYQIFYSNLENLDYLMTLIRQSYKENFEER
jgi:predicted transport protein